MRLGQRLAVPEEPRRREYEMWRSKGGGYTVILRGESGLVVLARGIPGRRVAAAVAGALVAAWRQYGARGER